MTKEDIENQSRFTIGTKSPYLHIIKYNEDNLVQLLTKKLKKFSQGKLIKFNFITTREIYGYLENGE